MDRPESGPGECNRPRLGTEESWATFLQEHRQAVLGAIRYWRGLSDAASGELREVYDAYVVTAEAAGLKVPPSADRPQVLVEVTALMSAMV